MDPGPEPLAARAIKAVQEKVAQVRSNGTLKKGPGYGANLDVKSSESKLSDFCKELIDVCQQFRDNGSWERSDLSYIAQISVSDTEVDEQDFRVLTRLITALKASSLTSLKLANCGLTREMAGLLVFQLFSTPVHWTRLDVSHNKNFCLPESRFALDCFNYVVRRNPLRVLNFSHTGFTNADIRGLLCTLNTNASSIRHLQTVKVGPPGSAHGSGSSQDDRAEQLDGPAAEELCRLLTSHHSLHLVMVWGAEGELAGKITQAGIQAGLQRDEAEAGCLRLKQMGLLEAEEHFCEFDPDVLQPVKEAQVEPLEETEHRAEELPADHYEDTGRAALQRDHPRPFAGVASETGAPRIGRTQDRCANMASRRHKRRHRRPSNRPAGAREDLGLPRKRRRHGPAAEHAAGHSRQAPPYSTAAAPRMATGPGPSLQEPCSPASLSFGEDLGSSDTGGSSDSGEYSPRAHEELHHIRLEVRDISESSPDSQGADARLNSAVRGMPPPAAAPVDLSPSGRLEGAPRNVRHSPRPNRATVSHGTPRQAPCGRGRKSPGTPISDELRPFGFESWASAEKHPPRRQFAKPDGPKRVRKRPAETAEALRLLHEQRNLKAQRHAGSTSDDASDSQRSQSDEDPAYDAESSGPEALSEVPAVRTHRLLQILNSEDQEQAQVPLLGAGTLAGSDSADGHARQLHADDAGGLPQASPACHSQEPVQLVDDLKGGTDSADRRTHSGTGASTDNERSGSALHSEDKAGAAMSGGPEGGSQDPAMDPKDTRESGEPAQPTSFLGWAAPQVQMKERTRRELQALMPFSWDKLADRHPANTEKMGVSTVENRASRRRAGVSTGKVEDSGGADDDDDPEDNVPLAMLPITPATKNGPSEAAQEARSSMAAAKAIVDQASEAHQAAQQPSPVQSTSPAAADDDGVAVSEGEDTQLSPVSHGSADEALHEADSGEAEPSGPLTAAAAVDKQATAPGDTELVTEDDMFAIVPDSEDEG